LETAKAIAKECGILTAGGVAMTGPDFRALSEREQYEIIPRLQVLARSSPIDKVNKLYLVFFFSFDSKSPSLLKKIDYCGFSSSRT
jgi:hypothetical protein